MTQGTPLCIILVHHSWVDVQTSQKAVRWQERVHCRGSCCSLCAEPGQPEQLSACCEPAVLGAGDGGRRAGAGQGTWQLCRSAVALPDREAAQRLPWDPGSAVLWALPQSSSFPLPCSCSPRALGIGGEGTHAAHWNRVQSQGAPPCLHISLQDLHPELKAENTRQVNAFFYFFLDA